MGQPLEISTHTTQGNNEFWALRLAQRALAALLDGSRHPTHFRIAELRSSAISALSVLSVDDRGLLIEWLGLQLFNASEARVARELGMLARIDGPLAVAVRAQRPLALARLALCGARQGPRVSESASQ